jgi:hypothetical protein
VEPTRVQRFSFVQTGTKIINYQCGQHRKVKTFTEQEQGIETRFHKNEANDEMWPT